MPVLLIEAMRRLRLRGVGRRAWPAPRALRPDLDRLRNADRPDRGHLPGHALLPAPASSFAPPADVEVTMGQVLQFPTRPRSKRAKYAWVHYRPRLIDGQKCAFFYRAGILAASWKVLQLFVATGATIKGAIPNTSHGQWVGRRTTKTRRIFVLTALTASIAPPRTPEHRVNHHPYL